MLAKKATTYVGSSLFSSKRGAASAAYLVPVQSDGSEGQHRHVHGAVLDKPADVAHQLPKNPGAAYKPHLKNRQNGIKTACVIQRGANRAFQEHGKEML